MASNKQLNKADITAVPYAANKHWYFSYDLSDCCRPAEGFKDFNRNKNFTIQRGVYESGSFIANRHIPYKGQYPKLVYDTMNHMFYQAYSGSLLNTGSLMFNTETLVSASEQRPTASYFDYNINPLFIDNFPTGSGSEIRIMVINQDTYGSKILPHSINMTWIESGSAIELSADVETYLKYAEAVGLTGPAGDPPPDPNAPIELILPVGVSLNENDEPVIAVEAFSTIDIFCGEDLLGTITLSAAAEEAIEDCAKAGVTQGLSIAEVTLCMLGVLNDTSFTEISGFSYKEPGRIYVGNVNINITCNQTITLVGQPAPIP